MLNTLYAVFLRLLRVPEEPAAPAGRDVRRFHASPRYLALKMVPWALTALAVLVAYTVSNSAAGHSWTGFANEPAPGEVIARAIGWAAILLTIISGYALVQIDYNTRWYIVTDRSLRIREGVIRMSEKTMTFANVQQLTVKRGPLQSLLGIADLEVRCAGGGGGGADVNWSGRSPTPGADPRVAYFRGVDNVDEIRTLIRERLRRYRDAGLGDPDDPGRDVSVATPAAGDALPHVTRVTVDGPGQRTMDETTGTPDLLAAAAELRDEARALREVLQ